jgi:dynein heavy chain
VSGKIIQARQLLRRIEEPIKKFKQNKTIMTTTESKKIILTCNKVARALIKFEAHWHHAWCKSIVVAKSERQATLIVGHPRTGKLFVNFDREILQLVRETKCLQRIGIEGPESANMVLLQEDKFKSYCNQLAFVIEEYDRVLQMIIPAIKSLLKPHLEDLNGKLQPVMLVLTWQSMNIDGYLHRIHLGLQKLYELVMKVNDIIENRIEINIKLISKTSYVDLPDNETFTLEQLDGLQEKVTERKTKFIEAKNVEIERAVSDLMTSVHNTTLDVAVQVDDQAVRLRDHYSRVMYIAILQATMYSLFLLKIRLTTSGFIMLDRPFFDVNVDLNRQMLRYPGGG